MTSRQLLVALTAACALLLAGCDKVVEPVLIESGPTADWPAWGGTPGGGHYTPLEQITPDNVDQFLDHLSGLPDEQRQSILGRRILGAVELARRGKPTEALEYKSRARWLSEYVNLGQEYKRVDDLVRNTVTPLVAWARGTRAVDDAQNCDTLRDQKARDQQLLITLSKLADIQPSLPGVPKTDATKWNVQARKLSEHRISRPVTTVLGRELDVRYRYEQALLLLSKGEVGKFAAAAVEIKRRFDLVDGRDRVHPELERIIKRLPQLAFEMLSYAIDHFETVPVDDRPKKIAEFRGALSQLSAWKTLPRWGVLDASLKSLEKTP